MSNSYNNNKVAEWAALVGASLPDPRPDEHDFETADGTR
ncbi:hypothetical protein C453_02212 [Haloferax elongans ATCC BAA-1513]|uniref:Uncharacterized protein n=1 Tax=Haloferax elongans ATCC BAA-1513 TaxID=1230453 RepID=M0HVH8_HALEO|nr:hypothetical protein C455_14232 [Haloferax larsenii JCM 13917]ELZ87763.1 hypothetical protein C453_02212 [Haloferax elongans ATCC BAA-1513]